MLRIWRKEHKDDKDTVSTVSATVRWESLRAKSGSRFSQDGERAVEGLGLGKKKGCIKEGLTEIPERQFLNQVFRDEWELRPAPMGFKVNDCTEMVW